MNNWKKSEKYLLALSVVCAFVISGPWWTGAMHIMEGYLPAGQCIVWGAVCLPFLAAGLIRIRQTAQHQRRAMLLLAMSGAFIFVISSLKIPSVTGSCSHMTGTGLAAILFGPFAVSVLGLIVLLFQALLLAHGGLSTLGANCFSMAIAGPILAWAIYRICNKINLNRKVSIFLAAMLGDLFTYCVTSMQLAVGWPSPEGGIQASAVQFLAVFAPTQLPLAIIEGILTVLILTGIEQYAQSELKDIGYLQEGQL